MAVEGLVRAPRAGGTVWGMAPWLFAFANDLRLAELRRSRVVRHFRTRAYAAVAGAVALTMLAGAARYTIMAPASVTQENLRFTAR